MTSVVMTWQAASTFGWGILGLNTFSHWAVDPDITPLMVTPISPNDLRWLDPLRRAAIREAVAVSNEFAAKVEQTRTEETLQMNCPVIDGLGNGFEPTRFVGTANIGRLIFEDTRFSRFETNTRRYDELLVASTWPAIWSGRIPARPSTSFTRASIRRSFVLGRGRG